MIWIILASISFLICVLTFASSYLAFNDSSNINEISESLTFKIAVFSFVLCIIFIFIGFFIEVEEVKDKEACEYIGGRYEVVGKENSMILVGKVLVPQTVDVYGCVR